MTPNTPLVSIIIPTFNRAHLIGETLDSVLAQTYKNWECIVVDDGSTDNTAQLMVGYVAKDARFQYHHRPESKLKGANACRNYGFEQCKGDFIQWFDSDDRMHPDKLRIKLDFALQQKADIIVDTHTKGEIITLTENLKVETFESSDFYIDYILGKKPVITNDVLVKRAVIGSYRFDENLHKAQEYEFFTRLFNQKLKYCFTEQPLTFYRESADSISKNTSKGNTAQVESLIYLSKIIIKRHSNNPLIVAKAEKQGRKTYKSLAKRRKSRLILKHFNFFRKAHHKSSVVFFFFMIYNVLFTRGFDRVKPKNIA